MYVAFARQTVNLDHSRAAIVDLLGFADLGAQVLHGQSGDVCEERREALRPAGGHGRGRRGQPHDEGESNRGQVGAVCANLPLRSSLTPNHGGT